MKVHNSTPLTLLLLNARMYGFIPIDINHDDISSALHFFSGFVVGGVDVVFMMSFIHFGTIERPLRDGMISC